MHGFNHLMALGGVLVGLPEVALETVWLSWTPDPFPRGATHATTTQRRLQCAASSHRGGAQLGSTRVWWSDFPTRSGRARRALAAALPRLPAQPGRAVSAGALHFVGAGPDNAAYLHAALQDSVRVGPGTHTAFVLPLPTLFGPEVMVSEAMSCGMQVDGAMNPYPLEVRWVLEEDDPRLSREGRREPRRGPLEWVLLGAVAVGR